MILLGYAPTVRSSPVPLYMRGASYLPHEGLGDDSAPYIPEDVIVDTTPPDFTETFSSSPGIFAPTDPVLQPLLDSGMSYDAAGLLADAAASGAITNAQFQQAISSKMSSTQLENLILGAGTFAAVAAAPSAARAAQVAAAKPPATSSTAQQIATAAANATKAALGPGASPRVASTPTTASPFTGSTSIAGMVIPNIALLGVGAVLLLAVTKGGR